MDSTFWLDKWQANEIGFHQTDIHPLLTAHWPRLDIPPGSRVLVPLCGKSRDMQWLARLGLRVIGFELSDVATADFFGEQALEPLVTPVGEFRRYSAKNITIFCGDFFAARPNLCLPCDAVYDRAALIALMPAQRKAYLQTLRSLCSPSASGLLISVEYPTASVTGPPFSIVRTEIDQHYLGWGTLREIERRASDVKGQPAFEVAYTFGGVAVADGARVGT